MTNAPRIRPQFTSAGAVERLDADDFSIIQYPADELEAGPHQVWLRQHYDGAPHGALGLLGPGGGRTVAFGDDGPVLRGERDGVEWCIWWDRPGPGMFGWTVQLHNVGHSMALMDLVCTLDAALTPWEDLRRNEYYVSQYLDVSPIGEGGDLMLAVRQNMPGDRNPWLAMRCTRPVVAWSTDALQLTPPGGGLDLDGDLPSARLQHEHTLAALQSEVVAIGPGDTETVGFQFLVVADHPGATSEADAERAASQLVGAPWLDGPPETGQASPVESTPFSPLRRVDGEELTDDEFLGLVREKPGAVEIGTDGRPWSYDAGGWHVVDGAKERAVLRPHGHILVATDGPRPADRAAAATVWMSGTLASHLTRGHANAQPLLTPQRSYLGLLNANGVRLLLDRGDGWELLAVPSAWAVRDERARWWWRLPGGTVTAETALTRGGLVVDWDLNHPEAIARLFVRTGPKEWQLLNERLVVDLSAPEHGPGDRTLLETVPQLSHHGVAAELAAFLPWLAQDAVVHYQVPRGLEQFTGGAWGTRDVCQGPVGLLTAAGRLDLVRELLLAIFSAQQDDGDWPQWFEFVEGHRAPGYRDSHGDIIYWPLLALGEYLLATGDAVILDEELPWVGQEDFGAPTALRHHVELALGRISRTRSRADSRLPAYGHGDWNDSLQPADPKLARSMTSAWTTELEIKTLRTLADGLATTDADLAETLRAAANLAEEALRERLVVDGELAGYAVLGKSGSEPLVHPLDRRTGLAHGSLQMIHAIADELFTPEEAAAHLEIIDRHLDGPTGILLFDRPVTYRGGELRTFKRAEAATFWGREIGLMYSHAHVRWVEALLRLGDARRAWRALQLVIPSGLVGSVPGAVPMQSNCYYSSVDAAFSDRYEAQAHPEWLLDPWFTFEGGWRVYSSGPGLVLRLVAEHLLGMRWRGGRLVIDPVLPHDLDGLHARVHVGGRVMHVRYRVGTHGHGVHEVRLNGLPVPTIAEPRRYRPGGVSVDTAGWPDEVHLEVDVG